MLKRNKFLCAILCLMGLIGCGDSPRFPSGNKVPNLQGAWTVILSGAAPSQGATPPPSTNLTVTLSQNGDSLVGTVTSVNNPPSSCVSAITNSGTAFTVSGNVTHPIEAGSNLNLTINFVSGSSGGTVNATGNATDVEANGLFSVSPSAACTGGTFSMNKLLAE